MSEFLDRIRAAENDIKNANKHLKAVEKEKENKLKNMEKGLQALAADKETLELKFIWIISTTVDKFIHWTNKPLPKSLQVAMFIQRPTSSRRTESVWAVH